MLTKSSSARLPYLDWVRGLAAITMLQGHVFDSFSSPGSRGESAFVFSQFLGGMPPAIFLFLTGITLAFLMDSTERKGMLPRARWLATLQRSGYLFLLAFAFRLQLWLFSQPAPWTDLFRVDILNCMGFAIAILSPMALFRTAERVKLCAVLALAIALAAPLISQMDWSLAPPLVRSYLVPDFSTFGFFPWGAYLAFGVSAGSLMRLIPAEATERVMQWAALAGGALILVCQYFAGLPFSLYAKSDYWLNSPAQVLTKMGAAFLIVAFAFLWNRYGAADGWSWVRQFGTTSLLVYWVHIELVYGHWFWFFKGNLNTGETAAAAAGLILVMLALSLVRTNHHRLRALLAYTAWWFARKPGQAQGQGD